MTASQSPKQSPKQSPSFVDQTIWTGDNLPIMRGMNSETVDLIYLDPPFNSNANYAAPVGSKAAGAAFKDTWGMDEIKPQWHGEIEDEHPGLYALILSAGQIHSKSMMAYLIYMAPRIMEMRRLLKPTGSIYLHCDQTASHYLKAMMDSIFGKSNFINEIIWFYDDSPGGRNSRWFPKKHDSIIFYAKNKGDHFFGDQSVRVPIKAASARRYESPRTIGGKTYPGGASSEKGKIPEDVWKIPVVKKHKGSKESTGYPTQKPLALLERIVLASSDRGDMVFDPFCGCATTCVAASKHGREWAGIDISPKAAELVKARMQDELNMFFEGVERKDIPQRTDLGKIPKYSSNLNRNWLYGVQSGNCNLCGLHIRKNDSDTDHMVPVSKGGSDHIGNLQLLCGHCNSSKGGKTQEEAIKYLKSRGIDTDSAKQQRKELEQAKARLPKDWPGGYA